MKTSLGFLKDNSTLKMAALVIVPAGLLACTSCSTSDGRGASESENTRVPARVQTYQRTATVTAIDAATRKITLTAPDGMQTTIKAGPEVRNFDQIRVGDQVKATTTQAMAISLHPPGMAPAATQSATVTVAPKGAKPGAVMTETTRTTARILAVDHKKRTVTMRHADGTTRTVTVGDDVDLDRVKPGQDMSAQVVESVAIDVEKP